MLHQQSVHAVELLAANLTEEGVAIKAIPGTPLSELMARSVDGMGKTASDSVRASSIPLESGGPSGHDLVMAEAVELGAKISIASFDLARNTIQPLVLSFIDNYNVTLGGVVTQIPMPVSIIGNTYHRIWASPILGELVAKFANMPADIRPFTLDLPSVNLETIRSFLRTGITQFDNLVESWFDDLPLELVETTWSSVFVTHQMKMGRRTNARHLLDDSNIMNRDSILLCFLIAKGMERAIPDEFNVSLEKLQSELAHLAAQTGRAITAEITRRQVDNTANTLVINIQRNGGQYGTEATTTVFVNNDVYLRFLEEPTGDMDSIRGVAATGGTDYGYRSLLDNAARNKEAWTRMLNLYNQRIAANRFTIQREALMLTFTRYLNSKTVEDLPADKSILHPLLKTLINDLKPQAMLDTNATIRDLTCDLLFADTNAKMFFCAMDTVEMENPGMSVREVALGAYLEVMAQWLAAQMVSTSISK
jgi:hypothetical protein